jgi:tetratricopeptide (TPR) repeat protein
MPLAAQQSGITNRVVGALDPKLVDPDCQLKGGDFRVSSGKTYLFTGITASEAENRARALRSGVGVLTEAIKSTQNASGPAWYWLGRTYLQQGDLAGADSAFTKAQALAPQCAADISRYRYRAWAALVNGGTLLRQGQQEDSALMLFQAANQIYREAPLAYVNIAEIYHGRGNMDSAIANFGRAGAMEPTDTAQVSTRNGALFNYGALLLNAKRAPEAVPVFEKYLKLVPSDLQAKKGLAAAYRANGNTAGAAELEKELAMSGGTAAAGGGGEGLTESDLFNVGAQQYNDKNYKDAAATFGKLTEQDPWYREAVLALANCYIALQDGPNLSATAERLIKIEPLNELAYSMWGQGYKFAKNQDKLVEALTAREALPLNIEMEPLNVTGSGASLSGTATGREARDATNKIIPPAPVVLAVEFLDQAGSPVATQEVTIPALAAKASQPIRIQVQAAGIKNWRYKKK